MPIVLAGLLPELALFWSVPSQRAFSHPIGFTHTLADCSDHFNNSSQALSVRLTLASHPSGAYGRRNYTKPSEQRQMYVYAFLPPIANPTSLSTAQTANPVHAPRLCSHLVLLLPVLSKLHLL